MQVAELLAELLAETSKQLTAGKETGSQRPMLMTVSTDQETGASVNRENNAVTQPPSHRLLATPLLDTETRRLRSFQKKLTGASRIHENLLAVGALPGLRWGS